MSTVTTSRGEVFQLGPERGSSGDTDTHTSHVNAHTSSETITAGVLTAKHMQVSDMGGYSSGLPDGLVSEYATVTEELDVIDGARIIVQPSEDANTPVIYVGQAGEASTQPVQEAGIVIALKHDEVILNAKKGMVLKGLSQISENVHARDTVEAKVGNFWGKCKCTTLFAGVIRPPASNTTVRVVGNLEVRGTIKAQDQEITGTTKVPRKHTGDQLNVETLTVGDDSLYIGLMRRSYDRASHKPVTHILKRQIPAFLVAKGFTLGDIPGPFTVDNMTINNWVTLAQDYLKDTSVEIDTVFPAATTADWEDYVDPISVDLDAAEVEIDDHETRITALEAAGVTIVENLVDNNNIDILSTDKIVLVKHDEKQGITCTMPASGMTHGQIISIKNAQFGDGSNQDGFGGIDYRITVRPAQNQTPAHTIDFGFTNLTLNASGDAPGGDLSGVNEACRLMWENNAKSWIALNDAY